MFNRKDHILRQKGVLSTEECNEIITFFETHPELHLEGTISGRGYTEHNKKKDTEIVFNTNADLLGISKFLSGCISQYKKEYPHINKVYFWHMSDTYKVQRYYPGEGYFDLHCENTGQDFSEEGMGKRILAWMIYLNDVTDGGHTAFPAQNKKFQPRRGDVLIWPAYFTHPHQGIVSKTQTKYIVTGWYNFKEC